MTVISDKITDLGHRADVGALTFYAPLLRDAANMQSLITPQYVQVGVGSNGVFTTPDLEPGPAVVRIDGIHYDIMIPVSASPIRLGPLIIAGLPQIDAGPRYVINGGGVARIVWITQAQWAAIAPGDPDTTYLVKP